MANCTPPRCFLLARRWLIARSFPECPRNRNYARRFNSRDIFGTRAWESLCQGGRKVDSEQFLDGFRAWRSEKERKKRVVIGVCDWSMIQTGEKRQPRSSRYRIGEERVSN